MKKYVLIILLLTILAPLFILVLANYNNERLIFESPFIKIDYHYFNIIKIVKYFLYCYLFITVYLLYDLIFLKK